MNSFGHSILLKLPKPIRKLFLRTKYFDPIRDNLEEAEEYIYEGNNSYDVRERIADNPQYVTTRLQVDILESQTPKWVNYAMLILTILILILTGIMLYFTIK